MAREQVGLLYEGNVLLRRWVNGALDAKMIGPIEATKLSLKSENEVKPRYTKRRGFWGKKVGSVSKGKPSTFSLGFNGVDPELMALLFLGETAALALGSGSITGESVTLYHDKWVKVSQRNISSVAITGSVEGTDFEVDTRIGAIKALSTGNLTDGGAVTFNASYGGVTGTTIKGGTQSTVEVEVVMDGRNLEDLSDAYVRVPKVALTPSSDMDLLADDYVTAEFSGEIELVDGEAAEFYVDDNVTYA